MRRSPFVPGTNTYREHRPWAKAVKERASYECERCGRPGTSQYLHAHHVNGDPLDHRHERTHYEGLSPHHTWSKTPEELSVIAFKVRDARRRNGTAYRTICHRGHPLTPDNVYVKPSSGQRQCLICCRRRYDERNARRRAATRAGGEAA